MSEVNAYQALVELATRGETISIDLPSLDDTPTHWAGLGFNLLGQRFVSPMDEVAELMRMPQATRVPGVKDFVVGVGNVRGRLMAILDLDVYFGQASNRPRAQRRVLAYELEDRYMGFIIDESLGMQHFPSDTFEEDAGEVADMFMPFLRGSYRFAGIQWPVLSLEALAQDPNFETLAVAA